MPTGIIVVFCILGVLLLFCVGILVPAGISIQTQEGASRRDIILSWVLGFLFLILVLFDIYPLISQGPQWAESAGWDPLLIRMAQSWGSLATGIALTLVSGCLIPGLAIPKGRDRRVLFLPRRKS